VGRRPAVKRVTVPVDGLLDAPYAETIDICAGPGGIETGARILGLPDMTGVDLDDDATDTGRAEGYDRRQHDMRLLDPAKHRGVRGAIITPPCPGFGDSGLRLGRKDLPTILRAVRCFANGCGCKWASLPDETLDFRSPLVVEPARWVFEAPDLEWFLFEQVPAVAPVWHEIAEGAKRAGWAEARVLKLHATSYGAPAQRERVFVYGRRHQATTVTEHDAARAGVAFPRRTMAGVLGLPAGTQVITRGERKTSGGNAFTADGPSWCLTGSTRSWKIRTPDGAERELDAAEAGLLNGFRRDYRWQGSRTKQFLQSADVVNPIVAAIALGIATDTPWVEPVLAYLAELYGPAEAEAGGDGQLDLFASVR
jgi:DNA (cytosine-5)-methyltransferase 1